MQSFMCGNFAVSFSPKVLAFPFVEITNWRTAYDICLQGYEAEAAYGVLNLRQVESEPTAGLESHITVIIAT